MRKILDAITPSFIFNMEQRLLLSSPLAWQFQLPRILWFWLLFSALGVVFPLSMQLEEAMNGYDMEYLVTLTVVLAILQFFLFGYFLLQFNATKSFIERRWWHGIAEQLVYVLVMFLCVSQFFINYYLWESRKAGYMTPDEIVQEIKQINQARHYFMAKENDYKYFSSKKQFVEFMDFGHSMDYYNEVIWPEVKGYMNFDEESMSWKLKPKYNRSADGPKLFYIGSEYMGDEFTEPSERLFSSNGFYSSSGKSADYTYQVHSKSKQQRLKEIKDFINLFHKYEYARYQYYEPVQFQSAEEILKAYESNIFQPVLLHSYETSETQSLSFYSIQNVHETVMNARLGMKRHLQEVLIILFIISLPFALLLFVYKNTTLRSLLLTVLAVILLAVFSTLLAIVTNLTEHLLLHVPLVVVALGLLFTLKNQKQYSVVRTMFMIVANVCFAMLPLYLFVYATEYWKWLQLPYDSYEHDYSLYEANRYFKEGLAWLCFWGGIVFYLLVGTVFFKKKYEANWALPDSK
ncbi:MAG: hypothetical protein MUF42_03435 [Cytophagaceae bacterium]|jgi:hypothetical protein|nr:hypothetical protein [Cytophagaceae bacterium]